MKKIYGFTVVEKKIYALVSTIDPPEESITSCNCPLCSFYPNIRDHSVKMCGQKSTIKCKEMGSYYWEKITAIKKVKIL
jgi:hypothetical protein